MLQSLYGNYRQLKFTDVWTEAEDFVTDYKESGLYSDISKVSDDSANLIFYLLYSRYGNSTIASSDINRFKYNLYQIIFTYGPTWEKELQIQSQLRALTPEQLMEGGTTLYNHAFNPSTEPSTQTLDELTYINEQNVTKGKRSKLDSYANVIALLKDDVTEIFIQKFKKLFLTIVKPELPLWYVSDEGSEE